MAAAEYAEMYQRSSAVFPEEAVSARLRGRMTATYPFHPTLIDFLNNKLALAENFQGTRGVLRVLAMTVRSLWARRAPVQLIHVSDIDLQNGAIVDELLGRTASADLRQVLTADIGSADTHNLKGGLSNAQRADQRNPHPDGVPLYEKTWKVVFLNSLVGRAEGHASKVFGISRQDAVFETATPVTSPSQVRTALEEIGESAFYLRYENGKYFAHLDPTINSVLAMIRQTIDGRQIWQKLRAVADGLLQENACFRIERNVHGPQDIADNKDRLTLAMVALDARRISPMQLMTEKGDGRPRERQNTVLLLVPKTVDVEDGGTEQIRLKEISDGDPGLEMWERLETLARQVLAIRALEDQPQAYGISPAKLHDPEFVTRKSDREISLMQAVGEAYVSLYYPNAMGGLQRKELRPTAGEGGAVISQIMQHLRDSRDIIAPEGGHTPVSVLRELSDRYFFKNSDKAPVDQLLASFLNHRGWPMLASRSALEQLLRDGVRSGVWAVYRMSQDPADIRPGRFYSQEELPASVDLLGGGYSVMTAAGAKKRGWMDSGQVPNERVKEILRDTMQSSGAAVVRDLVQAVQAWLADAGEEQIAENIRDMVQAGGYSLYQGRPEQQIRPARLVEGFAAFSHEPQPDEVLITRAEQSERGWLDASSRGIRLSGNEGARKIFPLLRRLGSLYTRSGAVSTIDALDITDLRLPGGGTLRFAVEHAAPADLKRLDELLQILSDCAQVTDATEADLVIGDPGEKCALIDELRK